MWVLELAIRNYRRVSDYTDVSIDAAWQFTTGILEVSVTV